MPPKKTPAIKKLAGAWRYTFALTDVAVILLLGRKYRPFFFRIIVFYLMFWFSRHIPYTSFFKTLFNRCYKLGFLVIIFNSRYFSSLSDIIFPLPRSVGIGFGYFDYFFSCFVLFNCHQPLCSPIAWPRDYTPAPTAWFCSYSRGTPSGLCQIAPASVTQAVSSPTLYAMAVSFVYKFH